MSFICIFSFTVKVSSKQASWWWPAKLHSADYVAVNRLVGRVIQTLTKYVCPRTGPHVAKLQAASMPIAWGCCVPRAGTDRRIAASRNAPPPHGGGHNNIGSHYYCYYYARLMRRVSVIKMTNRYVWCVSLAFARGGQAVCSAIESCAQRPLQPRETKWLTRRHAITKRKWRHHICMLHLYTYTVMHGQHQYVDRAPRGRVTESDRKER